MGELEKVGDFTPISLGQTDMGSATTAQLSSNTPLQLFEGVNVTAVSDCLRCCEKPESSRSRSLIGVYAGSRGTHEKNASFVVSSA